MRRAREEKEKNLGSTTGRRCRLGTTACLRPQRGGEERRIGTQYRWGDVKSEEWGGSQEEDRRMWGRRPSEEWPSVVSAVLR